MSMSIDRHTARLMITCTAGFLLLLLSPGCMPATGVAPDLVSMATGETEPSATVDPTPTPTPDATQVQPQETSTPEESLPIQLTMWTIEEISPQAEGEAGDILAGGLKAFEDTHPDVQISVVLKNESGKGSVLDYLRTASQVAPDVLPDVVVLNTVDLTPLARAGLLVPLNGKVSSTLAKDLLPGARAAGSVDSQLVGIPFEMDVEHLIYNTNKLVTAPMDWTDVLSSNTTYAFPAKGRNGLVNDAFLLQYLALGGRLQDDEGRPFIDKQALRSVLGYYRQGVEQGVITPDVLSIATPDDIWPSYVAAEVGMAHVSTHRFLTDREVLRSTQFSAIPTSDGVALTIGRGHALAVVTRDPTRQALALSLIEFLMAPSNNAEWNRARAYLPTRYAVFDATGDSDPYWVFLKHQLEVAVPPPSFPEYDQIGRVLQQAVIEVLSEEATPEEATDAAASALLP
jgi:ABC-type glycerol-3-phosphate transport system substrate-binding protein